MKKLNYFDETLPGVIGCDDADICLKCYKTYGLKCGSYYIRYYSPLEWGSTRVGPNTNFILNKHEVIKRYKIF